MKMLYGLLFLIIGIFNMYIGFIIYDSDIFNIIDYFNKLFTNSSNFLPLLLFAVGLLYTLIGAVLIVKKPKARTYKSINKISPFKAY